MVNWPMDVLRQLDLVIFDWGKVVWAVGLLWWAQAQPGQSPLRSSGRWGAALFLRWWLDARLSPGESLGWYTVRAVLLLAQLACVVGLIRGLSVQSRRPHVDGP